MRDEPSGGRVTSKRSFRRGRLSGQVVTELERAIVEEYPEPGTRLPTEDELADRFHVSRIVIREAMKILEDRGVVEVRAGRGTITVAPTPEGVKASLLRLFRDQPIPTLTEMEHMLELREVLEETVPVWPRCGLRRRTCSEWRRRWPIWPLPAAASKRRSKPIFDSIWPSPKRPTTVSSRWCSIL